MSTLHQEPGSSIGNNNSVVFNRKIIAGIFEKDQWEANNKWIIGYDISPEVLALGKRVQDDYHTAFLNSLNELNMPLSD